jgi:hypothetical protein
VLDHDAAVHHDVDAGLLGALRGFEVDDALLDPEIGRPSASISSTMAGMRREAEDVDEVGLDGQVGERGVAGFAETRLDRGG